MSRLLFEAGIPGLDFPVRPRPLSSFSALNLWLGYLDLGTQLSSTVVSLEHRERLNSFTQVNARGTATAELAADLTLGINYHVCH